MCVIHITVTCNTMIMYCSIGHMLEGCYIKDSLLLLLWLYNYYQKWPHFCYYWYYYVPFKHYCCTYMQQTLFHVHARNTCNVHTVAMTDPCPGTVKPCLQSRRRNEFAHVVIQNALSLSLSLSLSLALCFSLHVCGHITNTHFQIQLVCILHDALAYTGA